MYCDRCGTLREVQFTLHEEGFGGPSGTGHETNLVRLFTDHSDVAWGHQRSVLHLHWHVDDVDDVNDVDDVDDVSLTVCRATLALSLVIGILAFALSIFGLPWPSLHIFALFASAFISDPINLHGVVPGIDRTIVGLVKLPQKDS